MSVSVPRLWSLNSISPEKNHLPGGMAVHRSRTGNLLDELEILYYTRKQENNQRLLGLWNKDIGANSKTCSQSETI